ncbi:MAG: exosortase/archaeosortase family protein, partial [Verrucomicrobia bacterium]|nr:exosortase/archaeosortase family protein [Verrucomicrobiota bacterium]
WGIAIRQLSLEWTVNPLYQYGWWVIPLAAYLFFERIPDAPQASIQSKESNLLGLLVVFILLYLPFRIIQEANFDWILLNWIVASFAVVFTLYLIQQAGGKSWLLHFAFPILFVLTSVPWPVGFENLILQNLMRVNASITAYVLSLGSLEAFARGNIIEVGGQLIGVEEACSGIRSLQTSLMMSLFLGEFYRIKPWNRLWLLLLSFFSSFVFNSSRTVVLVYVGATEGLEALNSWHDPLGYAVLGISLIGLWGTAYWFYLGQKTEQIRLQSIQAWVTQIRVPKVIKIATISIVATIAAGELTTEAWYRSREKNLIDSTPFTIQFPESAKYYQEDEFSDITKTILKFNNGKGASWEGTRGDFWRMYLLEWDPKRVSKKLVSAHTPEVCYPAAGFNMESYLGNEMITTNGVSINFRTYLFRHEDKYFYVFHGVWEEKVSYVDLQMETEPLSRRQRIKTVTEGKRNLGQKILGVSIIGPKTLEEAKSKLIEALSSIIIPSDA